VTNWINKKCRFNRPVLQRLEDCTVPTAYLVNALGDAGVGAGTSGDIRYCLNQAALSQPNTVTFDTAGVFAGAVTITLTGGTLNVTSNTTLTGDGAAKLAIDGGGTTTVFTMKGAYQTTSTISGMTIQNGLGGIVCNYGRVTINDCVIYGNKGRAVSQQQVPDYPGYGVTITLNRDVVSNNFAPIGAGFFMSTPYFEFVNINSCSFTGNTASKEAGAMFLGDEFATISNSTFSGNSSPQGGAIEHLSKYPSGSGLIKIINSTIANNIATTGDGGGLFISGGVYVYNSTIANNTAALYGGGIYCIPGNAFLLSSSIVANNIATFASDVSGTITYANQSLLSNSAFATITNNNGTLLNVDPLLSPLGSYGGPTQTMFILPTSPAKDAGNNTLNLATDQRGPGYSRTLGSGTDMGAVEVPAGAVPFALATSPNVTVSGGTSQTVTVTYSDLLGSMSIDRSTIGNPGENEITVTWPGGFSVNPTFVSANSAVDAQSITATYSFTPPSNVVAGQWDYGDSGAYTITINANTVYDKDAPTPLAVPAGAIGGFTVTIPNPTPTASGTTSPDVTVPGGTTQTVTVTYTDTFGSQLIDRSTIGTGDITVAGPNGFSTTPTFVSASSAVDAMSITATYSFTAPDNAVPGAWDFSDNGIYVINMAANQVYDKDAPVSYPVAAGVLGTFKCFAPRVLTVNANTDTGAGVGNVGDFRYCLGAANGDAGLADTINFDPVVFSTPQTIALTGSLTLTNGAVTVNGPGASKALGDGGGLYRVLDLHNVAPGGGITISGLTIQNGVGFNGAGIFLGSADTTINDCVISGNTGSAMGSQYYVEGAITLNRDVVSNNFAPVGAGFWTSGVNLIINSCTFTGNTASTDAGAMYLSDAHTTISNSTFSGNSSPQGGAIVNKTQYPSYNLGSLTIINSTIANNTATTGSGGGLKSYATVIGFAPVYFYNSTIANNTATTGGGGIAGYISLLSSSIVASNSDASATAPDVSGTVTTANQSLIGNNTGTTIGTNNGTLLNVDPMLGPLASNGGLTKTMALLPGSPCISGGNNILALAYDQRGPGFFRSSGATDIGAFEVQLPPPPPTVVYLKIDDGTVQRSMIDSLTITFSEAVTFTGAIANAFSLHRDSAPPPGPGAEQGGVTGLVNLSAVQAGNVVTLTFNNAGPNPIDGVGLPNVVGNPPTMSLPDGRYTLTIDASKVTGVNGALDGNGDGTGGDNYVLASAPAPAAPTNIFRLFGDVNGDGTVSALDFDGTAGLIGFRQAFGGLDHRFDYNGDGSVAASDFTQFRFRFGGTLP
jgi:hypothetical protein